VPAREIELEGDSSGDRSSHARIGRCDVVQRGRRAPRFTTVDVDRRAPRDRRQPRTELAPGIEPLGRPPRLDEGLLGRLLGEVARAQRLEGDGEDQSAVLAIHRPHAIRVSAPEPLELVGHDHGWPRYRALARRPPD